MVGITCFPWMCELFAKEAVTYKGQAEELTVAYVSEKIVYPQIYASHNQDATDLYAIQGIPQIILFAPDGTIVQRDLRGEAIPAKVKEVFTETDPLCKGIFP